MNAKELAAQLTGHEYRDEIDAPTEAAAKAAGLVVVFGASDDLMEFKGALDEELGAYGGTMVTVDANGALPEWDKIDWEDRNDIDFMRDYFKREGGGKTIEALWCQEGEYSWTFKTDIPHETFEIVEDGEPFCRGIVFSLGDLADKAPALSSGQILDLSMEANYFDAKTMREYFAGMLAETLREDEGPLVNSGWQWELCRTLVKHGIVAGALDERGVIDGLDRERADAIILAAIRALGSPAGD